MQILADVAAQMGVAFPWTTAAAVRAEVARLLAGRPAYAGVADIAFARPVAARTWLQTSNPSERWKWDHAFQDNPPVKTNPEIVRAELVEIFKK